jgi:hypothetical protein
MIAREQHIAAKRNEQERRKRRHWHKHRMQPRKSRGLGLFVLEGFETRLNL